MATGRLFFLLILSLGCVGRLAGQAFCPGPSEDPLGISRSRQVHSLRRVIRAASAIAVLRVHKTDRAEPSISFEKVTDLKGALKTPVSKHLFAGFTCEPALQSLLKWAEPGKTVVLFALGRNFCTCVGNFWYSGTTDSGSEWQASNALEDWCATYVGPVDALRQQVAAILAGRDILVTVRVFDEDGPEATTGWPIPRDWLHGKKGRVCRVKAVDASWHLFEFRNSPPQLAERGMGGVEIVPTLVGRLVSRNALERAEAAEDLGRLGSVASSALTALQRALADEDGFVRVSAAEALARIDGRTTNVVPILAESMKAGDTGVRRAAVTALAFLGPGFPDAVPVLDAALNDGADDIRIAATIGIGKIGSAVPAGMPAARLAVRALNRTILRDGCEQCRASAVGALAQFGSRRVDALAGLATALQKDAWVYGACESIARLGPGTVPILERALVDPECLDRAVIANHLRVMGSGAKAALPALLGALHDESPEVRLEAAAACLTIDCHLANPVVTPVLAELLQHHSADELANRPLDTGPKVSRQRIIRLLSDIGPGAAPAVPALMELLRLNPKDDEQSDPSRATGCLEAIGVAARAAAPALRALIRDTRADEDLRLKAARALWRLGYPDEAGAEMSRILSKGGYEIEVGHALADMGAAAIRYLPQLEKALLSDNTGAHIRLSVAVWRLRQCAPDAGTRAPSPLAPWQCLLGLANDRDVDIVRHSWLMDLKQVPAPDDAIPLLVKCLRTDAGTYAATVSEILGQMGPRAKEAVPVLSKMISAYPVVAEGLFHIQPDHGAAAQMVARFVEIDDGGVLMRRLGEMGPAAHAIAPSLVKKALQAEHSSDYAEAIEALKKIAPESLKEVWPDIPPLSDDISTRPRRKQLAALWEDLGSTYAPRAYRAVWALAFCPDDGVPFLGERLCPAAKATPEYMAQQVVELGSPRFANRQRAHLELEKLGDVAEAALRRGLGGQPTLEVRRRIEMLLAKADPATSPTILRTLRAIEALKLAACPKARSVLQLLAEGAPEAYSTRAALAALGQHGPDGNGTVSQPSHAVSGVGPTPTKCGSRE
jgi:HEAT repeat protein